MNQWYFLRILCIDFLVSETSFFEVVCCFSLIVFYCLFSVPYYISTVLRMGIFAPFFVNLFYFKMFDSDGIYVCCLVLRVSYVFVWLCMIFFLTLSDCLGIFLISHGQLNTVRLRT